MTDLTAPATATTPSNTPAREEEEDEDIATIHQTYYSEMHHCKFMWTIPNFRLFQSTVLQSEPFSPKSHNYAWALNLHIPPSDSKTSINIGVKAANNSVRKFGDVSGNVEIGLINDRDEKIFIDKGDFTTITEEERYPPVKINKEYVKRVDLLVIKRGDTLEETNESLLPQGTLKIFCHLSFVLLNDAASKQSKDFQRHFNNQETSDLTIAVDGKIYPGHKFVLAASSPVFEAMFAHDTMEKQQSHIDIKDVDEKVFVEMLRYIYTGKVEDLQTIALDLAIAADKYNIKKLKEICEIQICDALTMETAGKLLISSNLYNLHDVKRHASWYIETNMKKFMDSEGWTDLCNHPELVKDIIHKIINDFEDRLTEAQNDRW